MKPYLTNRESYLADILIYKIFCKLLRYYRNLKEKIELNRHRILLVYNNHLVFFIGQFFSVYVGQINGHVRDWFIFFNFWELN